MTTSKITMAREILMAMEFLGIPSINFSDLKNQYGGLAGLYVEMENRVSGN